MSSTIEFAVIVQSWFDGQRHHDKHGPTTFIVRDGRVAEIVTGDHGSALTQRGVAVERGAFLMPGLVDAHVHLFLDGAATVNKERSEHLKQAPEQLLHAARASARQSLNCGVTLVRDAGDRHGINSRVREEARLPDSGLARVRSGGMGIKRAQRYGAFMAGDVHDERSIRDAVRALALDNDEIKLILTGIIDFDAGGVTDEPQFTLEEAKLVVATARAGGRQVFAHCSGTKGLAIAAAAGVGSIEHGFFMAREHLAVMLKNQVAWTPTFSPVYFQWAHPEIAAWSAPTVANLRHILDQHAYHLKLATEMGVTLLLGTDAGSMGVEHGSAIYGEIQRYLEVGLTLELTLAAATSNARRHFGFDYPTLLAGAPFDAILLAQDPFVELNALRQPLRVWPARTDLK